MKKIRYLVFLLPLLTGCYDYRELNDLAITTAVSIDYKDDNFNVVAEVINPTKQQDATSANASPFVIYKNTSSTLEEAFRNIVLESPRQLYNAQIEIIIITEDVVNNKLEEVLEFFSREPEIRTEIKVIVAKTDESMEAISLQTLLTDFSSSNILQSLNIQSEVLGITYEVTLNELLNMYLDPNLEIVLPSMELYGDIDIGEYKSNIETSEPKASTKISTSLITKDNKTVAYLTEEESKIVSLMNNKLKKTIINFPYRDGYVVFEPNRIKTSTKVDVLNNKVYLEIDGYTKIKGFEATSNIKDTDEILNINNHFNRELEKLVTNTFYNIRDNYKTDIFGYQRLYYITDYKYFNKISNNWYQDIFPNIEIEVTSNIKLYEKGNTLGGVKYEREN